MSSIPKINNVGKVKFATFQANESTTSPRVFLSGNGSDSFTPSFKGGQQTLLDSTGNVISKLLGSAKNMGKKAPFVLGAGLVAGAPLMQTSCCKQQPAPIIFNDETNVTQTVEVNLDNEALQAQLDAIIALLNQNNQQNDEIIANQRRQIELMIINNQNLHDIISYLAAGNVHLENLETNSQEIKDALARIEAIVIQNPGLLQENNDLLRQLLLLTFNMSDTNNANQQEIIALINQLLGQVTEMNQNQAANWAAIMQAMQTMSQELQAILLQQLAAIQQLDVHVQEGFQALYAQLNGMSAQMQAALMQVINNMNQWGGNIQEMFNQFMATFNQYSQMVQAKLAQLLAQMQHMEEAQAQQFLQLFNYLQGMQEAQQEQYLALLNQLIGMQQDLQGYYVGLMGQLQNMQAQQQEQFLALMLKLTNLENGQQAILAAMQGMNAQFLAMFAEALQKLDEIKANQVTQITQLAQIYTAIQNGNATLNSINEFIQNLNLGNVGAHLDVIEGLLAQILASQNSANNLLANQQQTLNFILTVNQTLQEQMAQVVPNQNIMIEWMEAIFNKIPAAAEGCNCEECCAQLIEILLQISEQIENLDWNHEGIDDNLDDILG